LLLFHLHFYLNIFKWIGVFGTIMVKQKKKNYSISSEVLVSIFFTQFRFVSNLFGKNLNEK